MQRGQSVFAQSRLGSGRAFPNQAAPPGRAFRRQGLAARHGTTAQRRAETPVRRVERHGHAGRWRAYRGTLCLRQTLRADEGAARGCLAWTGARRLAAGSADRLYCKRVQQSGPGRGAVECSARERLSARLSSASDKSACGLAARTGRSLSL